MIDPATTAEAEFYVVRYLSEGGFEGSFNVSHLNLTLEGLEKGTLYTLSVAPVNEAGEGTSNAAGPFQTAVDGELQTNSDLRYDPKFEFLCQN